MTPHFSGYATKWNIQCTDGRTIRPGAFKDEAGTKVPLVWQHMRDAPDNILGHALLEERPDGMYAMGYFNDSESAQAAKEAVKHGDINAMSIYANRLSQNGGDVLGGHIREVSLVLNGANPGALIDYVDLSHGENYQETDAIIYSGEYFEHADNQKEEPMPEETPADEQTVSDVIESMTEEQQAVLYALVGQALESAEAEQSDYEEGDTLYHNAFDRTNTNGDELIHVDVDAIFNDAQKIGSLKDAVLEHAKTYGITNIETLFPDARRDGAPQRISEPEAWAASVVDAAHHSPMSRIRTDFLDTTIEQARALGYVTASLKKDAYIQARRRVTQPTTVYRRDKFDRDDILDITDFDAVAMVRADQLAKLKVEIARAVLVGDGRDVDSPDKIDENAVRPILTENPVFCFDSVLAPTATTMDDVIDHVVVARAAWKGTGTPVMFTDALYHSAFLLIKDKQGRRIYKTEQELLAALRVSAIIEVPGFAQLTKTVGTQTLDVMAIVLNMADYTIGADKGGQVTSFDDFDIDYNQYKYLSETRISGSLTKPMSAFVLSRDTANPALTDPVLSLNLPTITQTMAAITSDDVDA